MKKTIQFNFYRLLISCCLLSLVNVVDAQQQQTSIEYVLTPKLGLKGGANFANFYIDNVQSDNLKVGVNAGLFLKIPIVRGLSIQPEVLYSNKGVKSRYSNIIQGSGEYRFNLNYMEVPLLLVFNVTRNLSFSAGGYAAYLLSANVKDVNNNGTIAGATKLNTDNFHRNDYGLTGGINLDIEKLTLGVRYDYGLQAVGQSGSLSGDLTRDSKNSVATIYFGFAF